MADVIIGLPPNTPTLGASPALPTGGVLVPVPGRDGHGIAMNGIKNTYAQLPTGLGPDDSGACYLVLDDNLVYFWSGVAWPAKGAGIRIRGDQGEPGRGIDSVIVTATGLRFAMSSGPTPVDLAVPALSNATSAAATASSKADEALASAGVAVAGASAADTSARAAATSATTASTAATNAGGARDQAAAAATTAVAESGNAATKATAAAIAATQAGDARSAAQTSANDAAASANSATLARGDAQAARDSATAAATAAGTSKTNAAESAATAQHWAEHAAETVSSGIPNADRTIKGGIMLPGGAPGELGGTFEHPVVAGWATKAEVADVAAKYTRPSGGISTADLATGVQNSLGRADSAYQRPGAGIPKADLDSAAQSSLSLADTAVQVDGTGKLPAAILPAIALTEFLGAVANQTAMLALAGQRGDWCTRTDKGTDWQLIGEPANQLANWRERTYPASPVSSVNGRTGAVSTSTTDITDATATGRAVLTATTAAAARSVLGAGTSSLTLGATTGTAAAGDDSRLSDQRVPTDGSVTNTKIAPGAAIALSKLATGYISGSDSTGARTLTLWVGSEAQFTAIGVKDSNTIYLRTA
ncbi:phage upper tail fiber protein [Nocardia sp. CA-128927]|uniref:phage upper tail fiber protein n=1 Tax=Nocardia sp. CA-128927 TaxID=3239975 RepID=UPI003D954F11